MPQLSAKDQMDVDHAFDEHQLLSPGARVLALWGNDYYAAVVCGFVLFNIYLVNLSLI